MVFKYCTFLLSKQAHAQALWTKYFAPLVLAPRLCLDQETTWDKNCGEIYAWTGTSALMSR